MVFKNRTSLSAVLVLLSFALVFSGCDSQSADVPKPATASAVTTESSIEIKLLSPLLPRLKTHIAVDDRSNIYWIQESDTVPAGGDLMYVMGVTGVPQTIPAVSVANILDAIDEAAAINATGAIRSIAIDSNGHLYILFTGGTRKAPLWVLARYIPQLGNVRIIAHTKQIMEDSGLGASLDLAHGSLVSCKDNMYLWLRHSDAMSLLKISPHSQSDKVTLSKVKLYIPGRIRTGMLQSESDDLSAGPDGKLYYVDRKRATLWAINKDGAPESLQSLEGFSSSLTACAVDGAGKLFLLSGEGPPLVGGEFTPTDSLAAKGKAVSSWNNMQSPTLLRIEPQYDEANPNAAPRITTWDRDKFRAPTVLPIQDMRPTRLIFDNARGDFIAFDAATGELLRIKLQ